MEARATRGLVLMLRFRKWPPNVRRKRRFSILRIDIWLGLYLFLFLFDCKIRFDSPPLIVWLFNCHKGDLNCDGGRINRGSCKSNQTLGVVSKEVCVLQLCATLAYIVSIYNRNKYCSHGPLQCILSQFTIEVYLVFPGKRRVCYNTNWHCRPMSLFDNWYKYSDHAPEAGRLHQFHNTYKD